MRKALALIMLVLVVAAVGIQVSTAVRLLKASIRLHETAAAFLVNGDPKCSFLSALLSILVARDSAVVAREGVDVTVARRILNLAERPNGEAGSLVAEGKPFLGWF